MSIRSYSGLYFSHIFPHSDWKRRDTPYLSVFNLNVGKCGKIADQNNSEYGQFLRHLRCLTEFWMYFWNMPILLLLFRISLWQWYVLQTFTEDFIECQSFQKLDYCWIIYRDSASIFIIFKNAWSLFFLDLLLTFNVRGENVKKASFYTNKSIVFIII